MPENKYFYSERSKKIRINLILESAPDVLNLKQKTARLSVDYSVRKTLQPA